VERKGGEVPFVNQKKCGKREKEGECEANYIEKKKKKGKGTQISLGMQLQTLTQKRFIRGRRATSIMAKEGGGGSHGRRGALLFSEDRRNQRRGSDLARKEGREKWVKSKGKMSTSK